MPACDPNIPLETPRLALEPLVAAHAAAIYDALQAPDMYAFIPQDPPRTPAGLETSLAARATRQSPDGRETWLNWVLRRRSEGVYVGTIEVTIHADRTAALAYMIFAPFQRQGYAKEGCERVIAYLFHDCNVAHIAAEIDTRNAASIRLAESLGFVRVATKLHADYFKGASSHEYRYELRRPWQSDAV
jgi:ribosomal-protein-alanine N-acetyltransferase